jgi:hypothetical protein
VSGAIGGANPSFDLFSSFRWCWTDAAKRGYGS